MFQTNPLQPPKKYIKDDKDGGGKLKLNPAYKAWKEGEANSNGNTVVNNNNNNNHAAATATAIHCPVDDAHLPTAIAIAEDEQTRSQIQASEQYQLQNRNNTTRPSQAEELRRWQDETASLPLPPPSAAEREVQRLRDENARLKTQQQYHQYQQYPPVFSQSMTTRPTPAAPPMGMMTASLPPQQYRTYSPPPPSSSSSAPPGTTLFAVQVPTGVSAGQQFHISVQGTQFKVRCPPNVRSGQTIHVPVKVPSTTIAAAAASRRTTRRSKSPHRDRRRRRTPPRSQTPTMYAAQIPPGVAPGQQFQISIHGKQYRVTCPANTYVGQTIHVPISR